jgi:hypothetical protein
MDVPAASDGLMNEKPNVKSKWIARMIHVP